jgi:hypothetical protein
VYLVALVRLMERAQLDNRSSTRVEPIVEVGDTSNKKISLFTNTLKMACTWFVV